MEKNRIIYYSIFTFVLGVFLTFMFAVIYMIAQLSFYDKCYQKGFKTKQCEKYKNF